MSSRDLKKFLLASALVSITLLPAAYSPVAHASAAMVKAQAPGYYRIMLGAFEITVLSDGTIDLPVEKLLSDKPEATIKKLSTSYLTAPLETSVNAYLINTGSKLILIDSGAGALFGPTLGKLLSNLKASGYEPNQIDEIYLSHMHPDHLGGLMTNGNVSFPNAIIRADQKESEYWLSKQNLDKAPEGSKNFFQGAMASMEAYVASGRYKPFKGEVELVPGIRTNSTAGHSIGHTSFVVESEGKKLLLIGDLIHVAAVQLDNPLVTIAFDSDSKAAAKVRKEIFKKAAKDGVLIGASHIQFPGLGHLKSSGESFLWIPSNYKRMP